MAEEVEPHLDMPTLPSNQPLAVASRCPVAIVVDKENKQCIAVAETAYAHLLDDIESDLLQISKQVQEGNQENKNGNNNDENVSLQKVKLTSLIESDPAPYLLQVEKIKQYIIDGDIFQANLSRQWSAELKHIMLMMQLYLTLCRNIIHPRLRRWHVSSGMTIISSSPERLVSLNGDIVETRPIAGTRRRDDDQRNDTALAEELLAHPKEQAEHIMLIDSGTK